jgi:hypothetical protein
VAVEVMDGNRGQAMISRFNLIARQLAIKLEEAEEKKEWRFFFSPFPSSPCHRSVRKR